MSASGHSRDIVTVARARWPAIALTYSLFAVEAVCLLSYGILIGRAIDDLLFGATGGLWLFVGVAMVHIVTGYARRRWDTRLFAGMHRDLAVASALAAASTAPTDTSAGSPLVARSHMLREVLRFLESDVPEALHGLIAGVGSLAFLFWLAPPVGVAATLAVALAGGIAALVARPSQFLLARLNDSLDREARRLAGPRTLIVRHHAHTARLRVRLSDLEATGFACIDATQLVTACFALVYLAGLAGPTPGGLLATFTYVLAIWAFASSLPTIAQEVVRASDLRRRLAGLD